MLTRDGGQLREGKGQEGRREITGMDGARRGLSSPLIWLLSFRDRDNSRTQQNNTSGGRVHQPFYASASLESLEGVGSAPYLLLTLPLLTPFLCVYTCVCVCVSACMCRFTYVHTYFP